MNFKRLFTRSLGADPGRLHFAAHSHHLWPDASYEGHMAAWQDAARLADRKWARIMDEIWPAAQSEIAGELGIIDADSIVFAPNTHELLVRVFAAKAASRRIRILTSDGEFHSARRQFARWEESGTAIVERVPVEPFENFSERFCKAARAGGHELIFVSQLMFASGSLFDGVEELARLATREGPWVIIDGYHAFMAIPDCLGGNSQNTAFYLGGGYKYAMAGEGCAFMHAPIGFGDRPPITGWFAEFEDLDLPRGSVGYRKDALRYLGATFDPSGLYRFLAVRRMLRDEGLTTVRISAHVQTLQEQLIHELRCTPLAQAELLNPLDSGVHARFLAFRSNHAPDWCAGLHARGCVTDVRGDVLRIGFGLYHDERDVERLIKLLGDMA